jgi:hypothetical protein
LWLAHARFQGFQKIFKRILKIFRPAWEEYLRPSAEPDKTLVGSQHELARGAKGD